MTITGCSPDTSQMMSGGVSASGNAVVDQIGDCRFERVPQIPH